MAPIWGRYGPFFLYGYSVVLGLGVMAALAVTAWRARRKDTLPNPLPLGEGTSITGRDVAERAAAGDAVARAILLRGAWALGVGLGNAANLVNPQRFVLGGGVTKSGEAWWAEARRAAAAAARRFMVGDEAITKPTRWPRDRPRGRAKFANLRG